MPLLPITAALVVSAAVSTTDTVPRTVEAEGKAFAVATLNGLTNPALTGFRLRYTNGDHEVKAIAMTQKDGQARGKLADQNGDDDMSMRASYAGWDYYRWFRTQGDCRGTCSLAVKPPPSELAGSKRLVLVNFDILTKNGEDRRVKVLSIRPSADERTYRVEFRGNEPIDYWVTLDYAWIASGHNGKTTDTATRTSSQRTAQVKIGQPAATLTFLAGFSVEFTNGEHNLGDLAFESDAARQYYVRFNDANYDDPMTATLDRVWIRE